MAQVPEEQAPRQLPVNLYDDGHELVAVLPMPGLTPAEIEIHVTKDELIVQARERGPRQDERTYLMHEWRFGPFVRRLPLPFPVDATLANAAHGNGVLTVALPKAEKVRPGVIQLREQAGSEHHKLQRHAGRQVEPRS